MSTVRAFATRHPVRAYFALTFAVSWGCALLAIGGSGGMLGTTPTSDPRFAHALVAMLAGPSVTGILLTVIVSGRTGLRAFLARAFRWRVAARWYAVAILTAPILMTATLLLCRQSLRRLSRALSSRITRHRWWHASITASLLILNPLGISGMHLLAYSFALAAAVWLAIVTGAIVRGGRLRSQRLRIRLA